MEDEAAPSHQQEESDISKQTHQKSNLFPTLLKPKNLKISTISNTFSSFSSWVAKSVKISHGFFTKRAGFDGMVVNNSVYCESPKFLEAKMEGLDENKEEIAGINGNNGNEIEECFDVVEEEESSSSSGFLASEVTTLNKELHSSFSEGSSSSFLSSISGSEPVQKSESPHSASSSVSEDLEKAHLDNRKLEKQGSSMPEMEMMKERFSKLLLGEDMSGCGNGVCTALAISNAITNLCATLFGQIWRLEPLPPEKKSMWRREMEWLLCVSDYIVELIPCWQNFPDGSKLEVMSCRPRSDLYINLPALRKLDNMLLEVLASFEDTEFWYVDQGIQAPEVNGSTSFRNPLPRQEDKWWLPAPRVPAGGLSDNSRKQLQHKRDCTNQILKAAMAINSITLADMDVPQSFLDTLPKNGKVCLGDLIHRYVTSDQFSPECLLDCLDLSSEHQALEIANRVEASIYMWRRRTNSKPINSMNRSFSKSSWEMVKDLVMDADKRNLLAERAESLLLCLRQRFPGLPQTALDMSKIQYNKDVGKSILESYSRVLESLAFNIVARIDDLLYVDDLTKHSDNFLSISRVGLIPQNIVGNHYPVPISTTPYKTAFSTPSFSPSQLVVSSGKGEKRSSFCDGNNMIKFPDRGFSVKKVLTDYLSIDTKGKHYANQDVRSDSSSSSSTTQQVSPLSLTAGLDYASHDLRSESVLSSSTTHHASHTSRQESPVSQTEGSEYASQGTRSYSLSSSTTRQDSPVSQTEGLNYASQGTRSDSLSTTRQESPVSQTEGLDHASHGRRPDSLSTTRQESPVSQTEGLDHASHGRRPDSLSTTRQESPVSQTEGLNLQRV